MDTVKTLSDLSLAKDWLPREIAHTVSRMELADRHRDDTRRRRCARKVR